MNDRDSPLPSGEAGLLSFPGLELLRTAQPAESIPPDSLHAAGLAQLASLQITCARIPAPEHIIAKRKAEADTSEEPTETADNGMNKTEAVKKALAEGVVKPQEGVEFIKTKFGLDITPQMFSAYKSSQKKKESGGHDTNGRQSSTISTAGHREGNGRANPAELARQVKSLVETYGAAAVKDMTSVFG